MKVFRQANHLFVPVIVRTKGENIEGVAPSESPHRPRITLLKKAKKPKNHRLEVNLPKDHMAEGEAAHNHHHRIEDTIKCAALLVVTNLAGVVVVATQRALEITAIIGIKRGAEAHLHQALRATT